MAKSEYFDESGVLQAYDLPRNPDYANLFETAYKQVKWRIDTSKTTPYSKRTALLKRIAYEIGYHILDNEVEARFEEFLISKLSDLRKVKEVQDDLRVKYNPFYWCIVCIGTNLNDPNVEQFEEVKRAAKLSRQLLNAYNNDVPVEYLIGYLHQTGGKEAVYNEKYDGDYDDKEEHFFYSIGRSFNQNSSDMEDDDWNEDDD